jgi:acyl carrier protein
LLTASDVALKVDELTAGEHRAYAKLASDPRRRAWLRGRRALRRALAACGYPTDTGLYRFPSPACSVSHSGDISIAAVALPLSPVTGIGVDVELGGPADPRTGRFFLTGPELRWLATVPLTSRGLETLRLWTVKEALFKADAANPRTTLRDYAMVSPSRCRGGAARGRTAIRAPGARFRYASLPVRRGFLTVAVALSPSQLMSPQTMTPQRMNQMPEIDFDRMAKHISSLISVPTERLTPTTKIRDLVPDSFTLVEIAVDVQEEFDVVLSQDDFKGLQTLGDLAALLQRKQS